jgi:hypothetical protein
MSSGSRILFLCLFPALLLGNSVARGQDDYQLGLGYKVNDGLTVGGYFSTEYATGENVEEFVVDDLALLAYGSITEKFSFLAELESVNFLKHDFDTGDTSTDIPPAIERLYGDFSFSDHLKVRFGKQIRLIFSPIRDLNKRLYCMTGQVGSVLLDKTGVTRLFVQ